jgi:hypothetical protein
MTGFLVCSLVPDESGGDAADLIVVDAETDDVELQAVLVPLG